MINRNKKGKKNNSCGKVKVKMNIHIFVSEEVIL